MTHRAQVANSRARLDTRMSVCMPAAHTSCSTIPNDLDNVINNSEGVTALSVDKPPPHATKVVYKQVCYSPEDMADSIIPHQAQVKEADISAYG